MNKLKLLPKLAMAGSLSAAVGILTGVSEAQASLIGGFTINPSPFAGGAGLILEGTGLIEPTTGNPVTNFDFVGPSGPGVGSPPTPPGFGDGGVIELAASSAGGSNDFAPYINWQGLARDLAFPLAACGGACIYDGGVNSGLIGAPGTFAPIEHFLVINDPNSPVGSPVANSGGFSVDLLDFTSPSYDDDGPGTTVSVGAIVRVNKLDVNGDVTDDAPSFGTGTFSIDFAGLEPDAVRALFDEAGEIPIDPATGEPVIYSWSGAFEITQKSVPEPSSSIALMGLGLVGGFFTLKNRKKHS